ncbi:Osteopetrosis-associated transmembrane protein 1 precursor [Popillia japonica]|uniref:triacylglycerol lipase n=1 Tax=Popillia japonica TaxID=7064 RepID=A0AAW1MVC8_POPJA
MLRIADVDSMELSYMILNVYTLPVNQQVLYTIPGNCIHYLGDFTSDVLRVATEARSRSLGPFHPSFNVQKLLLEGLEKFLPDNAHLMVNGKLHISLTRVYDGKNVIVSQFNSKEDLIAALNASCFIPFFSGILPPKFQGVRYMDGGFSDNLPTLDENTITVSPFCGESDICPRDDSMQLFHINLANTSIEISKHNIYRFARILFPPKPEVLSNICKQGFDDALRFLHRNNLINCTRCLAVQSTFVIQKTIEESIEYDPQCNECIVHRQEALVSNLPDTVLTITHLQEALVSNLPDTVLTIFQDAIDTANKGLINWIFKHRGMKLLSVLSLPYSLPADVMYATFTKFMTTTPSVGNKIWEASKYFLDQLSGAMNKMTNKPRQLSAKIACRLAITEYKDDLDIESFQHGDVETTSQVNLNFTLDLDKDERTMKETETPHVLANKILSRRSSLTLNATSDVSIGEDTFEHILQATQHHEALWTYYYLDENNKVKVTEIFDVTDSDSPIVQSAKEREINQQLQFDDDWNNSTWTSSPDEHSFLRLEDRSRSLAEISEYSIDDIHDNCNLFSDPESEWAGTLRVDEPEDEDNLHMQATDSRPESDQPNDFQSASVLRTPYRVPAFTYRTVIDHESMFLFTTTVILANLVSGIKSNNASNYDNCTMVNHAFGFSISNFTYCAITNSHPIKLCQECVNKYIDVLSSFQNLTKSTDKNGTACYEEYIGLDRLEIIETMYIDVRTLWNTGKCDECFIIDNGTLTPQPSNQTLKFYELYEKTALCIKTELMVNDTKSMCEKCITLYIELNDYYDSISNINQEIANCMDIVDLMNGTRTSWSKQCCRYRHHEEYVFIISTCLVL